MTRSREGSIGSPDLLKIGFRLERDDDGYPPADWEFLWGRRVGESQFQIESIPIFVLGISCDDIVSAQHVEEYTMFQALLVPSGHSTLRVMVFDEEDTRPLREEVRKR